MVVEEGGKREVCWGDERAERRPVGWFSTGGICGCCDGRVISLCLGFFFGLGHFLCVGYGYGWSFCLVDVDVDVGVRYG